jgi:hypothetical protein
VQRGQAGGAVAQVRGRAGQPGRPGHRDPAQLAAVQVQGVGDLDLAAGHEALGDPPDPAPVAVVDVVLDVVGLGARALDDGGRDQAAGVVPVEPA